VWEGQEVGGAIFHELNDLYLDKTLGWIETGAGALSLDTCSMATWEILTLPAEADMKGVVEVSPAGGHMASSFSLTADDDDWEDFGSASVVVSFPDFPLIQVEFTFDTGGDDVVGLSGIGYGATIQGASGGQKVEYALCSDAIPVSIEVPSWVVHSTFKGKAGASRMGEIRAEAKIQWSDNSWTAGLSMSAEWWIHPIEARWNLWVAPRYLAGQ